jgi:hypothetical protein
MSTLVPILTAAVFAASVVALLVSALALVRGTGSALLAGLILMTSSSFPMQPMAQYADVPLSFYYLATLALAFLSATSEVRRPILGAMVGAFASFAAWTKNEGLVFFVLSLGCYAFFFLRYKRVGASTAPVWYALLGALPGLLVAGYAFGLTQQQSGLLGQWEADLFTADWRAHNTAAFFAAFVNFLHASLRGCRLMRGENRLGGRQRVFRSVGAR